MSKEAYLVKNGWGIPIIIANEESAAQRYVEELNSKQVNKGNGQYSYETLPVLRDNYPYAEE